MGHDSDCIAEVGVGYCPPLIDTSANSPAPEQLSSPSEAIIAAAAAELELRVQQGNDAESAEQASDATHPMTEEEAEHLFKHYDTDGDGQLGMEDVVQMVREIKGTANVNPEKILEAWEWDQDGKVSLAGFKARLHQISANKPDWIPRIRQIVSRRYAASAQEPPHTPAPAPRVQKNKNLGNTPDGRNRSGSLSRVPSDLDECNLDEYISMKDISPDPVQSVGLDGGEDWLDHAYLSPLMRPGCCWPSACCGNGHAYERLPGEEMAYSIDADGSANSRWSCSQSLSCCGDGQKPMVSSWCMFQVNRFLPENVLELLGGRWGWMTSDNRSNQTSLIETG